MTSRPAPASSEPCVSIVIPVYNGANYVAQAIDSALGQSYGNIEVLVVNDGSDDGGATAAICRKYGARIRYFEKENGGVGSALNLALGAMRGDFFAWLSHDDLFYPDKIEVQIRAALDAGDEKIVWISDYDLIDGSGKIVAHHVCQDDVVGGRSIYYLLRGEVNGCTVLVPRAAFAEHGTFDEALRYTQDYDLWARMARTYEFRHIPRALTATRLHSGQETNRPEALAAGDDLWCDIAEGLDDSEKAALEGNPVRFHAEMANFLAGTPYERARDAQFSRATAAHARTLASVIIPFRDRVELTLRAIASVLAQTHAAVEVVLVDDGSSDDVAPVLRLADTDQRIRYLRQAPAGAAAARNRGLDAATGDYVAFLDSDDIYLPDKIGTQMWTMQVSGAMICHSSYYRVVHDADPQPTFVSTARLQGDVFPGYLFQCLLSPSTTMVDRRVVDAGLLRFDETLDLAEDVLAWFPVLRAHRLAAIKRPLTVIWSSAASAAFDVARQIEGCRTILDFARRNVDQDTHRADFEAFEATIAALEDLRRSGNETILPKRVWPRTRAAARNPAAPADPASPAPAPDADAFEDVQTQPLLARIAELEDVVTELRNSRSWRVTAPLRRILRATRRRRPPRG